MYYFEWNRIRKVLESKSNLEDDRFASLEAQLARAKQTAEDSERKYDEVGAKENLESNPHVVEVKWKTWNFTYYNINNCFHFWKYIMSIYI